MSTVEDPERKFAEATTGNGATATDGAAATIPAHPIVRSMFHSGRSPPSAARSRSSGDAS